MLRWAGYPSGALLALLLLLPRPVAAAEPLPWRLRTEVRYSQERNREAYREELQARIIAALLKNECFREVVSEGEADLVLAVAIDRLDVTEDKRFTGSPTGGAGEIVLTGVKVTLAGSIRLLAAGGAEILPARKFMRAATTSPVTPLDQPAPRAFDQAFEEPVRWIEKELCKKREKLRVRIDQVIPSPAAR